MNYKNRNEIDRLLAQVRWPQPSAHLREQILMSTTHDAVSLPPLMIPLRGAMGRPAWRATFFALMIFTAFYAGILASGETDAGGAPFYTSSGVMLNQLFTGVDG